MKRVLAIVVFVVVLVVGVIIGTRYFYVVGEGMKAWGP